MNQKIHDILEAGTMAPSGDNCQPWKFIVEDNRVEIRLLPERDTSLYSWGQRASYLAHGALLENIFIAAQQKGYQVLLDEFPQPNDVALTAVVSFDEHAVLTKEHELFPSIYTRCTNRKPYKETHLTVEQDQLFMRTNEEVKGARVALLTNEQFFDELASAGGLNERILFENKELHRFFFEHINWTRAEDENRRMGFRPETLEIPTPVLPMFKLARRWGFTRLLRLLNFPKVLAKQNAKIYRQAAAFGAIIMPATKKEDYLAAGHALQRTWLKGTAMGLSLQPLTGIFFLNLHLLNGNGEKSSLSMEHEQLIADMYQKTHQIFSTENECIALMFRVGTGGTPTARTVRLPIETSIEERVVAKSLISL